MIKTCDLDVYTLAEDHSDLIWQALPLLIERYAIVTQGDHPRKPTPVCVNVFAGRLSRTKIEISTQSSLKNLVPGLMLLSEAQNKFSLPGFPISNW